MSATGDILVLNAGSSSIKFALFDAGLDPRVAGIAEGIGQRGFVRIGDTRRDLPLDDHRAALDAILRDLDARGVALSALRAAGHRVVHGGATLSAPALLTPEVRDGIAACIPLAPLHNPHHLAAIDALSERAPDLPQVACFDTAFHATNPKVATRYAIPDISETEGIRRYGFHGISYASLVRRLPGLTGAPLPSRLLALHLGNGASLCAIRDGRSVATTMGYSPLEGLTMGTRSGGIDANAVLRLAAETGLERTRTLLNNESGLKGLSGGISDMRALLAAGTPEADFAVHHFAYWAVRHAGSMIAAMEGLDAVAFTGGIGENAAPVREMILKGLAWTGLAIDAEANERADTALHTGDSRIPAWIVPAREEWQIARDTLDLLGGT